jgi:predicted Zn-ribbon and HTH transcriptional regulator
MSQPAFPMNETDKMPAIKEWANCPKCGWHYKQSVLDHCPMCRHSWRVPVSYQQPPYEAPTLD